MVQPYPVGLAQHVGLISREWIVARTVSFLPEPQEVHGRQVRYPAGKDFEAFVRATNGRICGSVFPPVWHLQWQTSQHLG
jgi:hypothetical protein